MTRICSPVGIAYNELGVKFLFNPGSTEFWSDPRVSGPYGMWLRQIAKEGTAAKVCMNVVGHTSKTGSEQVNDALSLQRANVIKQRLSAESAVLGGPIPPAPAASPARLARMNDAGDATPCEGRADRARHRRRG